MPERRTGYKTALISVCKTKVGAKRSANRYNKIYGGNRIFVRKYKNKYQVRLKLRWFKWRMKFMAEEVQ